MDRRQIDRYITALHYLTNRSVESLVTVTSGSGLDFIASVADPSEDILRLLHQHSFEIHTTTPTKPNLWLDRILPKFPLARNIREMAQKFFSRAVCSKDNISPEIKLLNTQANGSRIITVRPTLDDMAKYERKTTYIDNPYNPMFRRAAVNSGGGDGGGEECQEVEQLKEALKYVVESFPHLKYLLIVENGLSLSPDFVRYVCVCATVYVCVCVTSLTFVPF